MPMTSIPYGGAALQIGALVVHPVFDGYARDDPTQIFPANVGDGVAKGARDEDWEPHRSLLDEDGLLGHGVGGLLIRTVDRLVLVDTGIGPGEIGPYGPFNRVMVGGELPRRLAELGVDPADITDVVFTHLHPDHYGWATARDAAFFPNATLRCHALDWDHFVEGSAGAAGREVIVTMRESVAPLPALRSRLETWEHDGPLLAGIDVRHAPGHTPGSSILVLSSGVERGVLLGDAVHCPVELLDDEWASIGDVDEELARRTRVALAREYEGSDVPLVGAHFPGMRFGRLLPGRGRRYWVV
jgi:glyoxylase-like metal-dependent hydrolase (beta-lactamase superfamily II)